MLTFLMIVVAIASYFLGAINGAIITSNAIFRKDIRKFGSGNAGLTNAYRVFGIKGAVGTLVIDVLKAAAAVYLAQVLLGPKIAELVVSTNAVKDAHTIAKMYAGFFAMVGHTFPIYYGFKGGKGVLVCGITALMINIWVGILAIGVFILITLIFRYVSLGSIVAGMIAFPLFTMIIIQQFPATFLSIICGVLIVVMHVPNIVRIVQGREAKFGAKKE
jgi:glycerol-3-phosphate acyltransferase PlsY